jgi:plasmid maintenance system antidote protein VapI
MTTRRKKIDPIMTGEQLDKSLPKIGFNQSSFSRALKVQDRTVRRWISGENEVPPTVALLVNLMLATDHTADDLKPVAS